MFGSGMTKLIISNKEMNDIMKIIKSLKEFGWLIRGVSETMKNEAEKQKRGFLEMLLGTLGASLLGNLLTGKGTIVASQDEVQLEQVKVHLELVKALLEQMRIFNAASYFYKIWNTKVSSKRT